MTKFDQSSNTAIVNNCSVTFWCASREKLIKQDQALACRHEQIKMHARCLKTANCNHSEDVLYRAVWRDLIQNSNGYSRLAASH